MSPLGAFPSCDVDDGIEDGAVLGNLVPLRHPTSGCRGNEYRDVAVQVRQTAIESRQLPVAASCELGKVGICHLSTLSLHGRNRHCRARTRGSSHSRLHRRHPAQLSAVAPSPSRNRTRLPCVIGHVANPVSDADSHSAAAS